MIIVGGVPQVKTEKCTINEGKVTCVQQDPELIYYSSYPELFLVEEGYCKEMLSL